MPMSVKCACWTGLVVFTLAGCQRVGDKATETQFTKVEAEKKEIRRQTVDKVVPRSLYNYEPEPIAACTEGSCHIVIWIVVELHFSTGSKR